MKSYKIRQFLHILVPLMILLFVTLDSSFGQTIDKESGGRGGFGAPVVKYTILRDQGVIMLGGRGGWNIAPGWTFGGGVYATITEVDARQGAVPLGGPDVVQPLDIKFECFGLDIGYAYRRIAPTHLTLNLFFGGAAAHYVKNKTSEQQGETDFMFLIEPAVGVERIITDRLHLNLAISYRMVSGVDQPLLKESDLNGPAVPLAVKFGRF